MAIDVVETSIADLQQALSRGRTTSVELVALFLQRISAYDCRGPTLNSIPLLNPAVFEEAAASDAHRAAGLPPRPLEGIPYTAKNSYKVKGLTIAAGSPAFHSLVASDDAFVIAKLREAGAVLLGQTNTPPMMAGGMQRGVYGRSESPYNLDYLPAAFASGSSNGSGASTAASLAAFGIGSETVSSGRSPASNNALVAYTPSRSLISPRGGWPLYPTCDVVVPHARSMEDLFEVLNVITAEDGNVEGDFWRQYYQSGIPAPSAVNPKQFRDLKTKEALKGKRIAVPEMYIGKGPQAVAISESVLALWKAAEADLAALGAAVVHTSDFPLVTNYERTTKSDVAGTDLEIPLSWNAIERGPMIAHAWNDFLVDNNDPACSSLIDVDTSQIWPTWDPKSVQVRHSEPSNAIRWADLGEYIKSHPNETMRDLPGLDQVLHALESARKRDLEEWLDKHNLDLVIFPANGDVAKSDADVNDDSARYAWTNGVKYSNGNRALRHLGVPTISVPMGIMEDTGMPVNMTFAGKAYDDSTLLSCAFAYEQATKHRKAPVLTPALPGLPEVVSESKTDETILGRQSIGTPELRVTKLERHPQNGDSAVSVYVSGTITFKNTSHIQKPGAINTLEHVTVFVDGRPHTAMVTESPSKSELGHSALQFECDLPDIEAPIAPSARLEHERTSVIIARDQTMIVVLVKVKGGGASGWLGLL